MRDRVDDRLFFPPKSSYTDEVEELYEPEVIDPNEEVGGLEEITTEPVLKETDKSIQLEQIIKAEIALNQFSESDEIEELEAVDEFYHFSNQFSYVASSNTTFIGSASDNFATVNNIFAEDLCIGTEYIQNHSGFKKDFSFTPVKLDFVIDMEMEDLLPLEDNTYYSLTQFFSSNEIIGELYSDTEDTIIESDGVYSISTNLSYSAMPQDPSFKALVDSILK